MPQSESTPSMALVRAFTAEELQTHRARVRVAHKLMFYWLAAVLVLAGLAYLDVGAVAYPHWQQLPFGVSFVALVACNAYWVQNDLKFSETASPDTLTKLNILSEVVPAVARMLKDVQHQSRSVTNAEADAALECYAQELTKHLDACLRKP